MRFVPAAIAVFVCALTSSSCNHEVRTTRQMTWECVPSEQDPNYPDAEPVLFHYVEDPSYFDLTFAHGLCQTLKSSGKSTAEVTYRVTGNRPQGFVGYDIELVNGQTLRVAPGPGRSGHRGDNTGPHPLARTWE